MGDGEPGNGESGDGAGDGEPGDGEPGDGELGDGELGDGAVDRRRAVDRDEKVIDEHCVRNWAKRNDDWTVFSALFCRVTKLFKLNFSHGVYRGPRSIIVFSRLVLKSLRDSEG